MENHVDRSVLVVTALIAITLRVNANVCPVGWARAAANHVRKVHSALAAVGIASAPMAAAAEEVTAIVAVHLAGSEHSALRSVQKDTSATTA